MVILGITPPPRSSQRLPQLYKANPTQPPLTLFIFSLYSSFSLSSTISISTASQQPTSLSLSKVSHSRSSMALARLALNNLHQMISSSFPASLISNSMSDRTALSNMQKQRWGSQIVKRFSATASDKASDEKSDGQEITVAEGDKKSKLFPRRQRRKGLWRNNDRNFVPALYELFPSGLGDALMEASVNISRLLENLAPSRLMGQLKEKDECYKLRYEVPGLAKEDLKITVEDGFLMIKGEHKEEKEAGSDDEYSMSYGYYNTYLMLPDDAKVDEIKAELKDGVLTITIPKTERKNKDVKEVQIN